MLGSHTIQCILNHHSPFLYLVIPTDIIPLVYEPPLCNVHWVHLVCDSGSIHYAGYSGQEISRCVEFLDAKPSSDWVTAVLVWFLARLILCWFRCFLLLYFLWYTTPIMDYFFPRLEPPWGTQQISPPSCITQKLYLGPWLKAMLWLDLPMISFPASSLHVLLGPYVLLQHTGGFFWAGPGQLFDSLLLTSQVSSDKFGSQCFYIPALFVFSTVFNSPLYPSVFSESGSC